MVFSVSSTLTAIKAFSEKMGVIANNIANVETEGFKKSRAILTEGPRSDVSVEISQVDTPGPTVVEVNEGQATNKELSNVDLAEEIPQSIIAQRGYEANLTVIKTQDEMLGSVLDTVG